MMLTRSGDFSLLLLMIVASCDVGVIEKVHSKKVYKPVPRFLQPLRDKDICLDSRDINDVQCDLQSDDVDEIQGYHQIYRTIDGTCNNVMHPLWGASNMPLKRLLSPAYEDGMNTPIGWSDPPKMYHGFTKPNPREVTLRVLKARSRDEFSDKYTDFVTLWGQFIDHDIDHTSKDDFVCSTKCKKKAPFCFPIPPAVNEPRLRKTDCTPVTRTYPVCDKSSNSVRQQLNGITAFIDASMVYGSTCDRADELRDFSENRGFLKVGDAAAVGASSGISDNNKYLMPYAKKSQKQDCMLSKMDASGIGCFFGGDIRANEHISLIALHTIWVREHNRIAKILKELNPQWNGNRTYQETRKIIGAVQQHIGYTHWLPYVVGKTGMSWLSKYKGYDSSIDPSTSNVFATAAFRYGHFNVNSKVYRLYNHSDLSSFQSANGSMPLHQGAFSPYRIKCQGGVDPVLRGVFGTPMKDASPDNILAEEITEHLFELAEDTAHDLGSLDIQRGRDHGLTGYNKWRQFCSDFVISKKQTIYESTVVLDNFDDLASEIGDDDVRSRLRSLYGHPDNIDLHVAGLLEDPLEGGLIGPTYTCLTIEQLRRTRDGDRFWYENPGVFSIRQLREIKRQTLARVLCDSGDDITRVQRDVFIRASYPDEYIPCDQIPSLDLTEWVEEL